jgi:eukaryotic-like serine/threonine-protein kinase
MFAVNVATPVPLGVGSLDDDALRSAADALGCLVIAPLGGIATCARRASRTVGISHTQTPSEQSFNRVYDAYCFALDQLAGVSQIVTSYFVHKTLPRLGSEIRVRCRSLDTLADSSFDAERQAGRFPIVEGYTLEVCLGEGGMGTVYRARRIDTQELVALKMLKRLDGAGIYQIKREFRLLADIVHPNLVKLFELQCGVDRSFFTMELVEGWSFLSYLGVELASRSGTSSRTSAVTAASADSERPSHERYVPERPFDPAVLRECFRQLAEGVAAIHRAGKLHCDLKPSNVIVETAGRVVVLDFGVSVSFEHHRPQQTIDGEIAGTPEYMSPEQAASKPIGPASDWYAFGAMLYEALCGRLPLEGLRLEIVRRKQSESPPLPSSLRDGVPADLEALCMALLAPNADKRPSGHEVVAALQQASHTPRSTGVVDDERAAFVGRERELSELRAAWRDACSPNAVLAVLTGSSGIGKSALLQQLIAEVARQPLAVVLAGRCYERESVPYKGFDPIIDELSRFLRRLTDREVAELLPRDMSALSRVFPVLKRVPAVALSRGRAADSGDLVEIRRRATGALKELLARIADSWRLLICIDDAQWGDEDSARLLTEILSPPDAPSLLVVLGARDEEDSPMLRDLLKERKSHAVSRIMRFVRLREMAGEEATQLALSVLGSAQGELASLVAREGRGNPFFVRELSLYANRHAQWLPNLAASEASDSARLEPMLRERLHGLSPAQRQTLELVAVASRPVPQALLARIAAAAGNAAPLSLHELRAARLIRLTGVPDNWSIECYHDRVREMVIGSLSASAAAECHRLLADAFEDGHTGDPEVLLEHYRSAGDLASAQRHALASAEAAAGALAFARAARLYRLAIALLPEAESRAHELERKLATVLANDGRLEEAAAAYERSANQVEGFPAIEQRRLAAQHYLTSGNREAGERVLRRVLEQVGLSYPASPGAALIRLLWQRLKLRLFGLKFEEREASELERARCDVCFSATVGLAMTDLLRTAVFSAQHLGLAIKAGEPERVARGLAFEMGVAPGAGEEGLRWAARALPVAERLSDRHGTAYHRGLFFLAQGHVAHLNGQWRAAVEWLARAEGLLRESQTPDLHWALQSGHVLSMISAVAGGDLKYVEQRLPSLMKEARQRGDRHRLALMAYPAVVLELARDRPDSASDLLRELVRSHDLSLFDLRDFTHLHCSLLIDRYCGREPETWARLSGSWQNILRSKLLVVNTVRVAALAERGSAALAQSALVGGSALRRVGVACARRLEREHLPYPRALSGLLRARLETLQGNSARSLAILSETSLSLDSAGMALHADCTRRVSATLMSGSMGGMLIEEADQRLRAQGVRNPERFAKMMVPGFASSERMPPQDSNG